MPLNGLFSQALVDLLQSSVLEHVAAELELDIANLVQQTHTETGDSDEVDNQDDLDGDFGDVLRGDDKDPDHQDDEDEELNFYGGDGPITGDLSNNDDGDGFSFRNLQTGTPAGDANVEFDPDADAEGIPDDEYDHGDNDTEEIVWTNGQFWNFVDHRLEAVRKNCCKGNEDYKDAYAM